MITWIFVIIILLLLWFYLNGNYSTVNTNDPYVDGHVDKDFQRVKEVFRSNLTKQWEPSGAAFAVYHKNRLVVDLWGGYADKECERLWQKDTLNVTFSSTKAVTALCMAKLVDMKKVQYDDLVTKYWPEFWKNGKEKITVQWVMSHMAGLPYFDKHLSYEDALNNPEKISEIIENEYPKYPPGSHVGYHPVTYGWIVDQIVGRVDEKHRSLGQFYREEVQNKLEDCDYYLGLPASESHRVARLTLPDIWQRIQEFLHNPNAVYYWRYFKDYLYKGLFYKTVITDLPWLQFVTKMSFNNPDLWRLEQGAVMGIGTARSLAKIFQKTVMEDGFLSKDTKKTFLQPYASGEDVVTGANVLRGNGLMFSKFEINNVPQQYIGHAGVGGQNIKFDLKHDLCFAYVSNGFKGGFGDSARTFVALRDALYQCVLNIENKVN
ncbi:unnamed protein product [Bursaphelenchus okinawaensis]|uniref:Beta-lactamase-related domain-containing protein n=1 Tax=Bursaphelenchus okinawaensis TaxID=465554 RepID=A0A811K263_9BILA|nr:unnamed protein product [Bursaphelenchus okinawaensis]CAG9089615.1 unnamed protein product [Bursaphelenchus okinawaensis]